MGNCTVTGGDILGGCSLRGAAAGSCYTHRAARAAAPASRPAGARVRVMAPDAGRVMEFDGPVQAGDVLAGLPLDRVRAAPRSLCQEASKADAFPELDGNVEVLSAPMKGVWRIRLVISAEELAGILAEQGNTEALIERVRMLAIREEAMAAQAKLQGTGSAVRKAPAALPALSQAHHSYALPALSQAHHSCERM